MIQKDAQHIWHPFRQEANSLPLLPIVRGKGTILYAEDGREYLDLVSSWWVNTHGHAHPAIAKAISDQAYTLEQVLFSDATHPPAVNLAEKLTSLLPEPLTRVFYSDNGSTAVEIALKMAYQFWYNQGQSHRRRFISFEGGYHGDTFGAMATGKSSGYFKPFESFLFHVDSMPYPHTWINDDNIDAKEAAALSQLEAHLQLHASETAALIIEPLIQGASGMRFCRPTFLQQVVSLVRSYDILVIFDEVMTGFGRTGSLFACEKAQVIPDIICLAKGLTGGFLPLSVTVVQEKIYNAFLGNTFDKAFAHGHSFGANPLGCAAALACLKLFEEEQTIQKIQEIEAVHHKQMTHLAEKHHCVSNIRIMGSIAALDIITHDHSYASGLSRQLKEAFFARGLFLRPLSNVIYLMPPYCTMEEQLLDAYGKINDVLKEMFA